MSSDPDHRSDVLYDMVSAGPVENTGEGMTFISVNVVNSGEETDGPSYT